MNNDMIDTLPIMYGDYSQLENDVTIGEFTVNNVKYKVVRQIDANIALYHEDQFIQILDKNFGYNLVMHFCGDNL